MIRYRRRFITFLLAIFLVNALAWSYSTDAFADWLTDEQRQMNVVSGDVNGATSDKADHHKVGQTCNHGCHAAGHFLGQISQPLNLFVSPTTGATFEGESVTFPAASTGGPFRPPRVSSLA